jgi:hypothetical protein
MARRPSGRLPADRASARPESAPTLQKGLSTEGLYVPPPTPEQQFDAVRAVEFQRQQGAVDFAGAAEILFALGLASPGGTTEANPAVPKDFDCPTCDAPKGTGCLSGDGRYMRFHIARIRLANVSRADRNRSITEKEDASDG